MISVSVKSNRRLSKVNIKEKAMRPLSYTQIALYQSHSLCYKLQYIDGLKSNDRLKLGLDTHLPQNQYLICWRKFVIQKFLAQNHLSRRIQTTK